eukprot:SAG22_NODE_20007_length_269_cov_0.917647_1_plen_57_part_01
MKSDGAHACAMPAMLPVPSASSLRLGLLACALAGQTNAQNANQMGAGAGQIMQHMVD